MKKPKAELANVKSKVKVKNTPTKKFEFEKWLKKFLKENAEILDELANR